MLVSTYPQSSRNLREMLMRLIAEDASAQDRLRGARMRGRVLGHPLTTYDPRLPLVGDRMMLLGDAAGLINPLNGEGIQYALHSARWAAGVAADCLASDRLDAASLEGYQQRVHQNLRTDMAFSRLIVQLFRNRNLNQVWLRALRSIAARSRTNPDYAYRVGFGQAMVASSVRPAADGTDSTARYSMTRDEVRGWAAGAGRALAEFSAQLTRAKITRSGGEAIGSWVRTPALEA